MQGAPTGIPMTAGEQANDPVVRPGRFGPVTYVKIIDPRSGDLLAELPAANAINVALQIIAVAGATLAKQAAVALPQAWPYALPEDQPEGN